MHCVCVGRREGEKKQTRRKGENDARAELYTHFVVDSNMSVTKVNESNYIWQITGS